MNTQQEERSSNTAVIPKGEECFEWVDDGYGDVCMKICPHWCMVNNLAYCKYVGGNESVKKQQWLISHCKICDRE